MLRIRSNGGTRLSLERLVTKTGQYGVWEFHVAANSEMFPGLQAGRHAALLPAEPKEGQEVELFAMLSPHSPQEEWKAIGNGTAHYL
ncbi:hypothetical protein P3T65_26210 [Pseudomonas nitroreducens]|uniref:hypothetical protein n=1 Tax=Pseudomonas nitroreducens TaxID=46680 RepID=UPI0023F780D9|nr:hypothetical protein [Pseudomonas nitroreducens]WEW97682.1 hypothetical protein P3T65_26210 [Pseudomonas nitroreducens]